MTFHFMFVHLFILFLVRFRLLSGKDLPTQLPIFCILNTCNFSFFPFWF